LRPKLPQTIVFALRSPAGRAFARGELNTDVEIRGRFVGGVPASETKTPLAAAAARAAGQPSPFLRRATGERVRSRWAAIRVMGCVAGTHGGPPGTVSITAAGLSCLFGQSFPSLMS
jgi:hypothetical protein